MAYSRHTVLMSLVWKLLERFSTQAVAFVVAIILARILSPGEFGMVAVIIVIMTISDVIIQGGLNMAVVQKKDPDNLDYSTIFYFSLGVALVLYAAVWFCAAPLSRFFHQEALTWPLRILCLSLIFYAFNSIQRAYVSKNMLYRPQFTATLAAVVVAGVTGIVMARAGRGVWALVWYYLLTSALTSVFMWITVRWRPAAVFSRERLSSLFSFGWKVMVSNTIISVFNNARNIIVGRLYPAGMLGFFDRGKQFPSLIVENINASVQTILFPVLSEKQDEVESVKATMRRSIKVCTFIIFPLMAWLAASADKTIEFLLTAKWLGAVPFMRIFCLAYVLMPLQLSNLEAIKSLGLSGVTLRIEIIKKCFEAAVLVVSAMMGIEALAWGLVLCNFIGILINIRPNIKYLGYSTSEQIMDFLPQMAVSAVCGAAVFLLGKAGFGVPVTFALQLACGALLYLGLSFLLKLESFGIFREYVKQLISG